MLEASILPLKLSQKTPIRINSCSELEQAASEATKAQGAPGSRPPVTHSRLLRIKDLFLESTASHC